MEIDGQSALVFGGASGLGAATSRALHERGASVVIADLNAEKGEALASELGERARFVEANVMESEPVEAAVAAAAEAEGGLRISVCCAGIGWAQRVAGKQGPHDLEIFHNVIKVNLIGTFNVLRHACSVMASNEPDEGGERGVCVNTASIAAFDGQIGQVAYAASKGGHRRAHAPRRPRHGEPRRARGDDRARPLRHAAARRAARGAARGARRRDPVPVAPRAARGVRRAGMPRRREHDAQRRDDPARRRAADAAEVGRAAPSRLLFPEPAHSAATRARAAPSVGAWPAIARSQRGQTTVEWVGLVTWSACCCVAVLAAAGAGVPGASLARAIAARIVCALDLGETCASEPDLVAAYGVETAALVREHAPWVFYEEGMTALPVDYRECRESECSAAERLGPRHRDGAGAAA